jgi:hypothetical protein
VEGALMFCAICTDDAGPFVLRPIGKDDALVRICEDCDTEKPREAHVYERGYEAPGGMLSITDVQAADRRRYGDGYHAEMKRRQLEAMAPPPPKKPRTAP